MRSPLVALAVLSLVIVGEAACDRHKVLKPTSDSTPPAITWRVENTNARTTTDLGATGEVVGRKGDTFRVYMYASDPEGIQRIEMSAGAVEIRCSGGTGSGETLGTVGQGLGSLVEERTLAPDSEGKVLTRTFIFHVVSPTTTCKDDGFTWRSYIQDLLGGATNYFNLSTDGHLRITVLP